jgi:uncharacterized protein (TIGR02677 family)
MRDLDASLHDLARNARDFHAAVAQLRREHDVDPERFLAYKHLLIDYLEQFLEHLAVQRSLIARAAAEVSDRGVDRLAKLAAAGDDSGGLFVEDDLVSAWRGRWLGLVGWFALTGADRSGADDLEAATTGAIRDLLALLRRVTESARRPITRASELVVLARWFRSLPDDRAAAELFDASFGLGRPLHLAESELDPEGTPASVSWWDAPPVPVSVTLREHGRRASPGRPAPATDYRLTKERLLAEHRAAQAARAEAAARLGARPIEGRILSSAEMEVFLQILDRAAHQRSTRPEDEATGEVVVEGLSARLEPSDLGMTVRTASGSLTVDGYRLVFS